MKRLVNRIKDSPKVWNLAGRFLGHRAFRNKLKNRTEKISRLIFVCSGNICRSPFADYRARQLIQNVEICSAGFHAEADGPADPMAIEISKAYGVDLSPHKTTRFSSYEILPTDLVLVMDSYHLSYIEKNRPDLVGQVVLLASFCQSKEFPIMIGDPWSQGKISFNFCYRQIEDALSGLVKYINEVNA